MSRLRALLACLAAAGAVAGSLPAAADATAGPDVPCVEKEPVGQHDDFAFPGRDHDPALFPPAATCPEEWEEVPYDDFAFPGRDLLPLFWPPTAPVADDAFPGKDAPPPE
jgi:hypothetical protein